MNLGGLVVGKRLEEKKVHTTSLLKPNPNRAWTTIGDAINIYLHGTGLDMATAFPSVM
jgi:hypothetical protein